jgi:hypothetical protein
MEVMERERRSQGTTALLIKPSLDSTLVLLFFVYRVKYTPSGNMAPLVRSTAPSIWVLVFPS